MKKIFTLLGVSLILASCGGSGSETNSNAYCDGDILIPFQEKKAKDWGFISINGEVVIDPEFDNKPSFAVNGIAMITKQSKKANKTYYQFIKIEDGKTIESDEKWDLAGEFREGLAPVRNSNEKVSFINEEYEDVITVDAEKVSYFNDGLAAICDDKNKWGFIDKTGKQVIPPTYDFVVNGFSNGYAIVGKNEKDGKEHQIIDQSGKVKIDLKDKYQSVISISNGLIKVSDDGEWGFIDFEGNKVVKMNDEWSELGDFINGFATFREDDEWGLINPAGEKIIKPKFESRLTAFDGKIWYKEAGEWGLMDLEGNDLVKPDFDGNHSPYPFMCGTTIVQDGEDFIFIDAEGKETSQEEYENIADFDTKYITDQPWNETFESDYFDLGSVKSLISSDLLSIKNAEKFASSFELNPVLLWGNSSRAWEEVGGKYKFHASYSNSYNFTAYQYSNSEEGVEEAYDEDEYGGEEREEIKSQYPKDAQKGLSSLTYNFTFDDNLGVTKLMSIEAAQDFAQLDREDQKLDLNKSAKVTNVRMSINLTGKGSGKASMLAELIAESWKSKIVKIDNEENEDGSYRLEGKLVKGKITIRTSGGSSVTVNLEYDGEEN